MNLKRFVGGMHLIHATCIALDGEGVLLRGPSGAGKSDLALRLIEDGARLVADDQVQCRRDGGALYASAPPALAGVIEVRGLGPVSKDYLPRAPLRLVADLVAPERIERVPHSTTCRFDDIDVPLIALAPFEASAPAKLALACRMAVRGEAPLIRLPAAEAHSS